MYNVTAWIVGSSDSLTSAFASTIPCKGAAVHQIVASEGPIGLVPTTPQQSTRTEAYLASEAGLAAVKASFVAGLRRGKSGTALLLYCVSLEDLARAGQASDHDYYQQAVMLCSVVPQLVGNSFTGAVMGSGFAPEIRLYFVFVDSPGLDSPLALPLSTGLAALEAWSAAVTLEHRQLSQSAVAAALHMNLNRSKGPSALQEMAGRVWAEVRI